MLLPLAARNHVNRMCLAADVPLIESGSAGYLGQVTVIKKVSANFAGMTQCKYYPILHILSMIFH